MVQAVVGGSDVRVELSSPPSRLAFAAGHPSSISLRSSCSEAYKLHLVQHSCKFFFSEDDFAILSSSNGEGSPSRRAPRSGSSRSTPSPCSTSTGLPASTLVPDDAPSIWIADCLRPGCSYSCRARLRWCLVYSRSLGSVGSGRCPRSVSRAPSSRTSQDAPLRLDRSPSGLSDHLSSPPTTTFKLSTRPRIHPPTPLANRHVDRQGSVQPERR